MLNNCDLNTVQNNHDHDPVLYKRQGGTNITTSYASILEGQQ